MSACLCANGWRAALNGKLLVCLDCDVGKAIAEGALRRIAEQAEAVVQPAPTDLRAELDRQRAAVEALGDQVARAEERALAAEQERDQWRERCGVVEAERDEAAGGAILNANALRLMRDKVESLEIRERANQAVGPCRKCNGPGWPVVIPEKARAVLPEVVCVACLFESHEVMRAERDAALRHLSPKVDDDTNGARLVKEGG